MNSELGVMQMIDSLSIGGAERVSVNLANAIAEQEEFRSFHCSTREEGMLKSFLSENVQYFFMNKKSFFDFKALLRLVHYIKKNKISIIHAHSSSFGTAILAKLFTGIKIVWHDHYGDRKNCSLYSALALKIGSLFFSYVISVNLILKAWADDTLMINTSKIEYIPNYADLIFDDSIPNIPGYKGKRIIVLANLRPPKDHINMLEAFKRTLDKGYTSWHLLFVGRYHKDDYSDKIVNYIQMHKMDKNVSILGERSDIAQILKHCDIGVLSSESEGLPVALLEYGLASLAVIATDVGECSAVLNNGVAGSLVKPKDDQALAKSLEPLMHSEQFRVKQGKTLNKHILKHYSKKSIIKSITKHYQEL